MPTEPPSDGDALVPKRGMTIAIAGGDSPAYTGPGSVANDGREPTNDRENGPKERPTGTATAPAEGGATATAPARPTRVIAGAGSAGRTQTTSRPGTESLSSGWRRLVRTSSVAAGARRRRRLMFRAWAGPLTRCGRPAVSFSRSLATLSSPVCPDCRGPTASTAYGGRACSTPDTPVTGKGWPRGAICADAGHAPDGSPKPLTTVDSPSVTIGGRIGGFPGTSGPGRGPRLRWTPNARPLILTKKNDRFTLGRTCRGASIHGDDRHRATSLSRKGSATSRSVTGRHSTGFLPVTPPSVCARTTWRRLCRGDVTSAIDSVFPFGVDPRDG